MSDLSTSTAVSQVVDTPKKTKKRITYESADASLQRYTISLTNAGKPECRDILKSTSISDEYLAEGLKKIEDVKTFFAVQKQGKGEQADAAKISKAKYKVVRDELVSGRDIARKVFAKDPHAYTSLGLNGETSSSIAGVIQQGTMFFTNLGINGTFLAKMAKFGYTKERVDTELAALKELSTLDAEHKNEMGEAVKGTFVRNEAMTDLDTWMSEFYAAIKAASKKNPELRMILAM